MSVENLFDSPLTTEEMAIQTCRPPHLTQDQEGNKHTELSQCNRARVDIILLLSVVVIMPA
jgi:hypothetical protein